MLVVKISIKVENSFFWDHTNLNQQVLKWGYSVFDVLGKK